MWDMHSWLSVGGVVTCFGVINWAKNINLIWYEKEQPTKCKRVWEGNIGEEFWLGEAGG